MPFPPRFFLTGTDTDVGKTVTAAALCAALDLDYWKPIQAGLATETDTERVRRLSGVRTWPEAYRLEHAASPHRAAEREGRTLDLTTIQLPPASRLLVEGAGGWMVPLRADPWTLTSSLVRQLELPVIIVARSGLGTLNHTFLTLRAIRSAGCELAGIVLVGDRHDENRADLEKHGAPILAHLPTLQHVDAAFHTLIPYIRDNTSLTP